jgi:hypothetical protein
MVVAHLFWFKNLAGATALTVHLFRVLPGDQIILHTVYKEGGTRDVGHALEVV